MTLAYSYRRFSTPQQATGDSTRRQEAAFASLCAKHRWEPATVYFDSGKSGWKKGQQKDLQKFLDLLKAGQIPSGSVLVIESLDRMSRQGMRKTVRLIENIIENGVAVATTNPERVYDDKSLDDPLMMMEILFTATRAKEESDRKSERVKAAAFSRHQRAKETGSLMTRRTPSWLVRVDDKWKLVPERVAVVKRIFKLAITHGLGQRAIAKRLNAEGVPSFSGGKWGWAMVRLILVDGRVTGTFKSRLGDIPDYFPAVISKADYSRVLLLTKKREKFRGRTSEKIANLFTGLAYDADTGSTMVYVKKGATIPARWIPSIYEVTGKPAGKSKSFNYEIFEQVFLDFTKELKLDADDGDGREESGALEQELDQLDLQIDALKRSIADSDASQIPEMVELVASLSRKRVDLQKRIEQASLQSTGDALHVAKTISERLAKAKGPELVELRSQLRQAIRNLVSRIDVTIKRAGYSTRMLATIHFTNGHFRMIGIFTYRGVLDSVFTNKNELRKMTDLMELEVAT